jgi:lysophospholipid acyltransferase
MAFFASPAKPALRRALEQRAAKAGVVANPEKSSSANAKRQPLVRTTSNDSVSHGPVMGLSDDLEKDVDEALSEIKAEMEARARRASASKPLFKKAS